MRRKFISKIILGTMISTTLCTLVPIKASAEWVKDYQNNWYYTQDNQKMTGWKRIDGQLYYFDDNGKMQTGWIKAGSSWYFLQNNGVLQTGWINYNKNLYYADSSGAMQTGTINVAGKVYMLGDNGVAKTRNTVIDGQFYTIGSNGEVVGMKVPTPDKEFDDSGNVLTVLKNTDNKPTTSPTDSKFNEVIEDQSVSNDDPNQGRTFKVRFKDTNGSELKVMSAKNGKTIDLYAPTKDAYVFASWNTKSDGSGKSYADSDSIKVKEDINLYAQWTDDTAIYVDGITIKGSSYVTLNSTTQMTAEVSPSDASNTSVTWSVTNGTGKATIDSNGLLTGTANGTVTVKATSKDGSNISGMKEVTVSATEVVIPVSQISVTSNTGVSTITANGGTLQMKASVLPTDANKQDVTWTIENRTGSASIDDNGLVTALSNGIVVVKAIATNKDGSTVVGSTTITISGQNTKIDVESIIISGKTGNTIDSDAATGGINGTLQMTASVSPTTASNKLVTWSVVPCTDGPTGVAGNATITPSGGLITAQANGDVRVKAVSQDNPKIFAETVITIMNQSIKASKIEIAGDTSSEISSPGGNLKMIISNIEPLNASYKLLTWSVENKTGSASIDSNGVLKAISDGDVNVIATATNKDGSKVVGNVTIKISGQNNIIPVTSILVSGENSATAIRTDDGTLQMVATLIPTYTTTTSSAVTWGVSSLDGTATISKTGILKALTNGSVRVKATIINTDNTTVVATKDITLSGQYTQVKSIAIKPDEDDINNKVEVNGTLQMSATVDTDATYKTVTWEVESISGSEGGALINKTTGLLTAKSAGEVNVIATADNGKGITQTRKVIIIPKVLVTDIAVKGYTITNGVPETVETTEIKDNKTLQMSATLTSTNGTPTNKGVTWSVESVYDSVTGLTGKATIDSSTGILTAVSNGKVTVKATAKDGSGVVGSTPITISGKVAGITVTGVGNATTIVINGVKLQMSASVLPVDAYNKAVEWSVVNGTGKATIDSDGLLTAVSNGTVTVKAAAKDGSGIVGQTVITISVATGITINQSTTPVASPTTIKLSAIVSPNTATNKKVLWTISNPDGTTNLYATVNSTGDLTADLSAIAKGTVDVKAVIDDGSGVCGIKTIIIN